MSEDDLADHPDTEKIFADIAELSRRALEADLSVTSAWLAGAATVFKIETGLTKEQRDEKFHAIMDSLERFVDRISEKVKEQ